MNPVIRAFIAIEMPPEIKEKLGHVSTHLKENLKGVPVRWVQPDNIHLTLKFFGDISESNLSLLQKVLESEISNRQQFEMSVGELGAFPNTRQPRVIWIKVQAPDELNVVQHGIEIQTENLGYAREKRPFFPHLTLGRVSRSAHSTDLRRISEVLEKYSVGFLGAVYVQSINLYRSDLRPEGAVYSCLFSINLKSRE